MCLWLRKGASTFVWENQDRLHGGRGRLPCLLKYLEDLTEMTEETFHMRRRVGGKERKKERERKGNREAC